MEPDKTEAKNQTPLDAESKEIDKELKDSIPKERLDAEIAKTKQLETQLQTMQNQFDLLKANMPQPQQPVEQPKGLTDDLFTAEDTVVDPRHIKEFGGRVQKMIQDGISQINNLIATVANKVNYPDSEQILQEHFLNVVKQDSSLLPLFQQLYKMNPAMAQAVAYRLAKTDPAYLDKQDKQKTAQDEQSKTQREIQELLKNKNVLQSISALGSGGGTGGSAGSPLLDKIAEAETPEQFQKLFDDIKSGAVKPFE